MNRKNKKNRKPLGYAKQNEERNKNIKENINVLWETLMNASAEERQNIINGLDEDIINILRTSANPFKKSPYAPPGERKLAFNMINLTEKYSTRFAMTSIIGFIYRMLDEYKPDDADNYPSENDALFAIPFNTMVRQFKRDKPEEILMEEFNKTKKIMEENEIQSQEYKNAARHSFVIRAKIIKNRIYWLREDFKILKETKNNAAREVESCVTKIAELIKTTETLTSKKNKKIQFELEMVEKQKQSRDSGEIIEISPTALPEGMTAEDIKKRVSDYNIMIENNKKLIEKMEIEKISKIQDSDIKEKKYREVKINIKIYEKMFLDLKAEFLDKTGRKTKAKIVRKLGKKNKEKTELDEAVVDKYELNDDDYDSIAVLVKKSLNIVKTAEEHTIEMQNQIEKFLDFYFRYNPDNHVRNGYKPNYADTTRKPLASSEKNYERSVTPPDDTFFRLRRYYENNYEELRQATDDIYCEKSDLEFAIVPLEIFTNDEKGDADTKFDTFKRKYADEFDAEVYCATFNSWNLLSSWEKNREVRDFYTENTEIIKRIIDQHKEDERIGTSLMKDRAKKKKAENEIKEGPHDPALNQYRKAVGPNTQLEKHGAKHIDYINPGDLPRDDDKSNKDEIEVGVHVIKPYIGGGRRKIPRGESEQWKFHIPAEKMEADSARIMSISEFQKENKELIESSAI